MGGMPGFSRLTVVNWARGWLGLAEEELSDSHRCPARPAPPRPGRADTLSMRPPTRAARSSSATAERQMASKGMGHSSIIRVKSSLSRSVRPCK